MTQTVDIVVLLVSYIVMFLILWTVNRLKPALISYQNPRITDLNTLAAIHLLLICLMVLPLWFISSVPFFLLKLTLPGDGQLFGLYLCLLLIACWPTNKEREVKQSSENDFPKKSVALYSMSRIVFLIMYEWFFRGLLLMESRQLIGTTNAIILNILLYTVAHFHKDRKEIIGCIPFGLILCVFTISWQSIWPAVAIHLALALKCEWRPVYHFFNLQKKAAL